MSRRWPTTPARALLALSLVAAATAPLGVAGADDSPGGTPVPTLTVTPGTELVDHQLVTVTGDGFVPDRRVDLVQCPPRPDVDTCGPWLGQTRTDADGHFSTQVGVGVLTDDFFRDAVDCRTSAQRCTIRTFGAGTAKAPILFDPDAPEAPPPTATVDPDDSAVDGELVDLAVTGLRPGTEVTLYQCGTPDPGGIDGPGCGVFPLDDVERRFLAGIDGRFDARVRVRARVERLDGGRTDCRAATCSVLVADDRQEFAAAPFQLQPDSALAPRAEASATPATGLQGRQAVQVTGAHFFTGGPYGWTVIECTLPLPGVFPNVFGPGFACDDRTYEFGAVEDDGTFSAAVTARAVIRRSGRQVADCRRRSCGLVVLRDNRGHRADQVVLPLTFAAPAG